MSLHVAPAEWFWLLVNGSSVVLTVWAVVDARQKRAAVRALNGRAREITAAGNVRREGYRLVMQLLLLSLVLPSLFSPAPILLVRDGQPNWFLITLIVLPLPILVNSLLDLVDRRRVLAQTMRDIERRAK